MKSKPYTLTEFSQNEMRDYALYTVTSRAIPSMIDSLKPVQRFYLYSSIVNSKTDFKKVSAVSGVVSDYGYAHGETSAASAGQLMAATWNNNICLVEGRGSFGSRLIQEAGAARYVYTRLHQNFNKYIKDIDLAPEHSDPEHLPPAHYIPVIPLVIVNGTKGIATGFATNILPRSPNDVKKACEEYIRTGKIKRRLSVSFPEFKGTTRYDATADRYVCEGVYQKQGKTKLTITEVPYGYDRETYIKILDKLEDDGDIVRYDDKCNAKGFEFEITLKQQTSANWSHDEIMKNFKLSKTFSENLNVIDQNDKLKEYTDERDLIKDFCDYRLTVLQKRIALRLAELTEQIRWLTVKKEFIQAVLDDKIKFKNKAKNQVAEQILATTSAIQDDTDRLLRLNIMSLTKEQVDDLIKDIQQTEANLKYWQSTTDRDQFLSDLSEI